jgi:putative transcriptional regulator
MTISHHPSEETLARYAAGTLAAGPAIVLATHLEGCAACRSHVADFETVGGLFLAGMPPTPLAPQALAQTLARLDAGEVPPPHQPARAAHLPAGIELPAALHGCDIGRWRWLAPGMRSSRIRLPDAPHAGIMLLRVGPTRKLPQHGHTGIELTQILSGSFSDRRGRYLPGDIMEADDAVHHQPIVDPDGECICLIAIEGKMRLRGLIARLMQPFVGI